MNGFAFYIGERSADIHNRNVSQLPRVRTEIQTGLPRLGEYILPYGGQEYETRYECAQEVYRLKRKTCERGPGAATRKVPPTRSPVSSSARLARPQKRLPFPFRVERIRFYRKFRKRLDRGKCVLPV